MVLFVHQLKSLNDLAPSIGKNQALNIKMNPAPSITIERHLSAKTIQNSKIKMNLFCPEMNFKINESLYFSFLYDEWKHN